MSPGDLQRYPVITILASQQLKICTLCIHGVEIVVDLYTIQNARMVPFCNTFYRIFDNFGQILIKPL
jgi:hypothetical protein